MYNKNYELHGDTGTRLYVIWKSMKYRCNTPDWKPYKNYGGRGISVCSEWNNSYISFKNWSMNNGYEDNLELDRIDVNGNYCPENCRWITHHKQTENRRDTLYVDWENNHIKLIDFCKQYRLNKNSVNNWRHENILENKILQKTGLQVIISGGKK